MVLDNVYVSLLTSVTQLPEVVTPICVIQLQ